MVGDIRMQRGTRGVRQSRRCGRESSASSVASVGVLQDLYRRTLGTALMLLITLPAVHNASSLQTRNNEVRDYCQFESFDASCAQDEVVLMKSARYGRMRVGRCVARDYGFIACAADVLEEVDKRCSGNRKCHFQIPTLRDTYQPCPKDLTAYLEASYSCVKNANFKNSTCQHQRPIMSDAPRGFISTTALDRNGGGGHGSARCPLIIRGKLGQKINITAFSFSPLYRKSSDLASGRPYCLYYAIIREGKSKQNVSLCSGTDKRLSQIYLSKSNVVTFYFDKVITHVVDTTQALLQYQVVGCPNPPAPRGAWVERKMERAIVRCNLTTETWYLTCRGDSWVGSSSNCTKVSSHSSDHPLKEDVLPLGLLIAIVIGVIVGILVGLVLLIFVFFYRRKSRRNKLRDKTKTLLEDECHENEENYARRLMHADGSGRVASLSGKHGGGCADYTQMWELRHSHRVHNIDPMIDSPYGPIHSPAGTVHVPPNACCNNKNGTTFTTFKPREPIYMSSRRPINMTSILHPNLEGAPFFVNVDPASSHRNAGGDSSNNSPSKRPDILSSNRSGQEGASAERRNTAPDESSFIAGELCGHCALHQSADNIMNDDGACSPHTA